ncbi:MAG: ProQ/FinO family protein [Legionellaceae bacterium]|nr:ProQ/FinO family protein [Legionellaceae bacterium]
MRKQVLHPRTAAINQKQKNQSKKARLDALHWLALTFPNAFDNRVRIQPLNLGIMDEILTYADKALEAGISKSKLREAVVLFTRRLDYLACLKARDMRIDLDGNPIEPVTEDDAERAAIKIKKRVEKSVKNARKLVSPSAEKPRGQKTPTQSGQQSPSAFTPYYPERPPAYSAQNSAPAPVRASVVTVKHKQSRQYDPDAVARLKEKLGLSRKQEETSDAE